jgi:uncharacterized protein (DUF58 family)
MVTTAEFIDPVALAAVSSLGLRARLVVEGLYAGLHKSPFKGFSVEFSEYRSYQPGDDIRLVDWRAYARSDRYYVREFEAETNLRFYVCVDASASMAFPAGGVVTKFGYAATCAAALAYLTLAQRDAVALATFARGLRAYVPPRSQRQHFQNIVRVLERTSPEGKTDLYATLAALAERAPRRGLFAVFTDLWDTRPQVLEGLRALRAEKHEVILFHILDPGEERFPFERPATFWDLESGDTLELDAPRFRAAYGLALAAFKRDYRLALGSDEIDYVPVVTDTPPAWALVSYLARRRRMY